MSEFWSGWRWYFLFLLCFVVAAALVSLSIDGEVKSHLLFSLGFFLAVFSGGVLARFFLETGK